ncbi:hypothetical protein AZE42_02731 [Rhizopogon vesiculosus]|uniref:Uncharacterized protein n=1 Tax=Rhizopogon vesiculosus TaxID=180088 RepID=A0A1J8QVR9_9AGAM|nr:hypothetical protein AZE42_02731 [Rhizopogon vesiculosus]
MRFILVSTILLAQVFTVLSQQAQSPYQGAPSCEEYARQKGHPTDGWKVVLDSNGQPKCRREDVKEICFGVDYIDADTNIYGCCQDASGLTWINAPAKLAKCCATGHAWSYDKALGPAQGGCCTTGSIMQNGQCIQQPPSRVDCPPGLYMQDGKCVPLTGPGPVHCGNGNGRVEPASPCTSYPICGRGKYLGIKYGHCYILSFGDGLQLGTTRENTLYVKGGFFNDIPFKVCNSTTDCSLGKTVEVGESFYLQDQQGRYNDPQGTKGWIDNAYNGAHIGFTLDANSAGTFGGVPTCAGGECAIQLLGGPNKGGISPACPTATPGVSFYANPKIRDPVRFSEVTCDDYEVPPTSGISQNVQY